MIVGFVAIAAGLAVLVYSDTVLRLVLLDQTTSTTLRTAIGALAGLLPAWRASRLVSVQALRSE